ncbi:right-handed parallel beta-helix repeat-containing protein [Olivibacter jilunii]|uniref:right-handed parallel beta-helix repeat-containing protein n=1 Tax=Olivibacter jilunii TaxID=985016 RepID=UPI0010318E5A|nr:right-handed parallel beta-helix repeat-containing protein [Olivibacter jilunii]
MMKSYLSKVALLIFVFASCGKSDMLKERPNVIANGITAQESALNQAATIRYLPAQNGPDETSALQALIDQSVAGDIIIIRAGNHYFSGTVHINKSGLTIRGEHNGSDPTNYMRKAATASGQGVSVLDVDVNIVNTVIDWIYVDGGMLPEPNIRVFGNDTKIYNSHFRNSGHSGILIHNANRIWIEGVKTYYNYVVGISQWGSSDNRIKNCQTYENGGEGITIDGGSHNCFVENVWIYKNNTHKRGVGAIGIDAANGANIFNCTIDQTNGHAVRFQNNLNQPDDGCQVYNNIITNNQGCAISMRHPQLVTNFGQWGNTMTNNTGGSICSEP